MLSKKKSRTRGQPIQDIMQCSFCEKSVENVRKLIAGPHAYICDECVEACVEIMADDRRDGQHVDGQAATGLTTQPGNSLTVLCALCGIGTPASDGLVIPNRGILCPGCVVDVEAAAAERREAGS